MAKSLDDIYSLLEGMDDNLKNVAKSRVSSKEKGEDKDGDNNKRTEVWDRAAHSIVMWLFKCYNKISYILRRNRQ